MNQLTQRQRDARPDLSESVWKRAWADAKLVSLDTLLGLLVITAGGAAGGALASRADFKSDALEIALVVAGTVLGAAVSCSLFLAIELARVPGRQRDDLRRYLRDRDEEDAKVVGFKAKCLGWATDVSKFLDVQKAKEPPRPKQGLVDILQHGRTPDPPDRAKQREEIQRETVSLYIERYRDDGLRYFDALVAGAFIVPDNRPKFESPTDPHDIWIAADSMRTGAERI
jgi:hypothetical protein